MRRTTAVTIIAILAAALTACAGGGSSGDKASSDTKPAGGPAAIGSSSVTAATAWAAIHKAVPTSRYSLTVTEANDGNHLLGRPHQYTSAVKFADTRVKASDVASSEKGDVSYGGGIEVFGNHSDAQARADYIQAIVKASPIFAEYDYVSGDVVIRISHYLSPAQAAEYKTAGDKL